MMASLVIIPEAPLDLYVFFRGAGLRLILTYQMSRIHSRLCLEASGGYAVKMADPFAGSIHSRRAAIETLKSGGLLDVLIVGGGINGAGLARELALRSNQSNAQLRIGLVERNHFASGTSGKNSQLIHGGLRYLKYFDFGLVREALRERGILLQIAPHLVEVLPFLMPMRNLAASLLYRTGLALYDGLAGKQDLGGHRTISLSELHRLEPGLNTHEMHSAALFHDCRVHSARLVLENILDAMRYGVAAANYIAVRSFQRTDAGPWNVALTDTLSGEQFNIQARKLVNATGAWSKEGDLRLVRGSHLILPRMTSSENAIAYFEASGRIVFFIPWGESRPCTLVGTTEVDHNTSPDDVHISQAEVDYLLSIVRRLFPSANCEPLASYSSLRPLVRDESKSPTSTSREHRIWNSDDGVLHIAGGKYTTYRLMCSEAADLFAKELDPAQGLQNPAPLTAVLGNTVDHQYALVASVPKIASDHALSPVEARQVARYGTRSPALIDLLPDTPRCGLSRLQSAQIAFAVRYEMAQRLTDVMRVSTYWGYESRWDAAGLLPIAEEMGSLSDWGADRVRAELDDTLAGTQAARIATML